MSTASGFATGAAIPSVAGCFSASSQIWCSESASAQIPSQWGHSRKWLPPMTTAFITTRQRGHNSGLAPASFHRSRLGAAMGTKLLPREHHPKARRASHRGQARAAMVALRGRRRGGRPAHRAIQRFSRHRHFLSQFTIQHSPFAFRHYILRPNSYFQNGPAQGI